MKIIKHARESATSSSASPAAGKLLGLDTAKVLSFRNAFSLPAGSLVGGRDGEEGRGSKLGARALFLSGGALS